MSAVDGLTSRIQHEVSAPLAALGLDLEAVELTPAGKRRVLRIAVDQDGGVSMDDVAAATREVNQVLDGSDVAGAHLTIARILQSGPVPSGDGMAGSPRVTRSVPPAGTVVPR